MDRLTNKERNLRKELTVKMDLRGLDWEVGRKVPSVKLTGDGTTISDTRCIEHKIDLDSLEVTTVLLEEV